MKKLLFVYDCMMMGGTTTALIPMLDSIDAEKYSVDLLLYNYDGPFMEYIPEKVNLLPPAYKETRWLSSSQKKIILTLFNGGLFEAFLSYLKYRNTPKGRFRFILAHASAKAQVTLSRTLDQEYDVAIGYIERWSDHYVLSDKVKAKKKIVWVHQDYRDSYLIPEFDKDIYNNADRVVMVSKECVVNFQNAFPQHADKADIMENIVSTKFIKQRAAAGQVTIKKGRINFVTVCRCSVHVKGLDRVLDILARLKEEDLIDGVVWHFIGDGAGLESIRQRVEEERLEDHVVLYGTLMNPFPYLEQMDAFLLLSRYEGKPIAVTEAMAMKLPCILANYTSASEQVQHGFNGLIAGNDLDSMYSTVKSVIEDNSILDNLRKNLTDFYRDNTGEIEKFYALIGD